MTVERMLEIIRRAIGKARGWHHDAAADALSRVLKEIETEMKEQP